MIQDDQQPKWYPYCTALVSTTVFVAMVTMSMNLINFFAVFAGRVGALLSCCDAVLDPVPCLSLSFSLLSVIKNKTMYTHQRSVSDYRTTPDHLSYGTTLQDSGFSSTNTYYKSRENCGGNVNHVDTDGRTLTAEFDSGRRQHKPKMVDNSGSEFVVSGYKHVPSHHAVTRRGSHHHPPLRQYVPTSSYRTHSDERHPRQEMITPKLINVSQTHPVSTTILYEPTRQSRHVERKTVVASTKPLGKQRSVSPQIERRERYVVDQGIVLPIDSGAHNSMRLSQYAAAERSGHSPPLGDITQQSINPLPKGVVWQRKSIDMSIQSNREDSFISHVPVWSGLVSHIILMMSGFFYTGYEDIVKCNYCHVEIGDWDAIDDVPRRHFMANPNCPHLRREYLSIILNEICPWSLSLYSDFGERYKSFQFWPIPSQVKGGRLAEAGFYYMKKGVQTQCYRCGIIKDDWTNADDPFQVHMELCDACPHISDTTGLKKIYKVEYKTYDDRLKSYKNIPEKDVPVDKTELASAGFVLVRPLPFSVQCPDCDLIITDWRKGDDPLEKHMTLIENCTFLDAFKEMQQQQQQQKQYSFEDEGVCSEGIQYPPSYKTSISSSSNESVSLPSQSSFDKEDMNAYKRSLSTPDDSSLCIVCFEYPKECAIVPCGHFCVCKLCADKLQHCPICRQPKNDVLKIFIP